MMRIKELVTIISLTVLIGSNLTAVNDTIIIKSESSYEKITADLDSLVNTWYVRNALAANPGFISNDTQEG
jgi:hypothetical protein